MSFETHSNLRITLDTTKETSALQHTFCMEMVYYLLSLNNRTGCLGIQPPKNVKSVLTNHRASDIIYVIMLDIMRSYIN